VTDVRRTLARPFVALVLLMTTLASFGTATTLAQSSELSAYVWANDPLADSYTPDERYQFNSTSVANTITHTGIGTYTVALPGMGTTGNIQITATSGNNEAAPFAIGHSCEIAGEPTSQNGAAQIGVVCTDLSGAAVDTGFMLLYVQGNTFLGAFGSSAYLWANDPAAESYTPEAAFNFNSTDVANTITRQDVGTYIATLPGAGVEDGTIQVSASNVYPGTSCTASRWELTADGSKNVTVLCYDATGALVDASFELFHGVGSTSSDVAMIWATGAYVWVNHGEAAPRYTPGANFQYNAAGGAIEAERQEAGIYEVYIPGVGIDGGVFLVTAFGTETAATACSVRTWDIFEGDIIASVNCFAPDGTPTDSRFMLSYTYPEA